MDRSTVVLGVLATGVVALLVASRVVHWADPALTRARETNTARGYTEYASSTNARDEVRPDLRKLHDALRKRLVDAKATNPTGVDTLLATLLERVDYGVGFVSTERTIDKASFAMAATTLASAGAEIAPIADYLDNDYACADGLTEGFREMTASDVITFIQDAKVEPQLRVHWRLRASGDGYVQPNSRRIFPGIVIAGDLTLVSANATFVPMTPFEVAPADKLTFTSDAISGMFKTGRDADVAAGLVRGACKQLGVRLATQMTGWSPPVKAVAGPDEKLHECEEGHGSGCFAMATQLRDGVGVPADPKRALGLFEKICRSGSLESGQSCIAGAELALKGAPQGSSIEAMDARAKADIMLGQGCHDNSGEACVAAGTVKLLGYGDSDAGPSSYAIGEAIPLFVRACDLGSADGCDHAAVLLATRLDEPSFSGAAALARRACAQATCPNADAFAKQSAKDKTIFGITLGADRVFDVRWGDWFNIDQGRVVAWVASPSDVDAARTKLGATVGTGRARVYALSEVPFGPKPPAGTKSVWAVIYGQPSFKDDQRCRECMSAEASDPMLSAGCVCLPLGSH